MNIELIDKEGT